MPRPPTTYQFDLFSGQRNAKSVQTPRWQVLPAETRRSVTKLIISLILDHIDGERIAQMEAADHDA